MTEDGPGRVAGMVYTGHMIGSRFAEADEGRVAHAISGYLDGVRPRQIFGSMAAGADILVADAARELGCEHHVVLPCTADRFVEVSVAPSGKAWIARFEQALSNAHSVTILWPDLTTAPNDVAFAATSYVGMGLLLLEAGIASTRQLAVWDETITPGYAGTVADMAVWHRLGGQTDVITTHGRQQKAPPLPLASLSPVPLWIQVRGSATALKISDLATLAGRDSAVIALDRAELAARPDIPQGLWAGQTTAALLRVLSGQTQVATKRDAHAGLFRIDLPKGAL